MADEQAAVPFCIQCEYNLTGLASDKCPECGWQIDWALAALDEEGQRPGTPAHRARGWRRVDATIRTVLLMLFAPWRFAKQLRHDESLMPALWTALVSFAIFLAIEGIPNCDDFEEFAEGVTVFGGPVVAVVLCQSLCFSMLHYDRLRRRTRWHSRFRMWLSVSLYSTCFVASWPVVEMPPYADFSSANFYIPLIADTGGFFVPTPEMGVTIITYWWWLILAVMLVMRNRPRWLAAAAIPLVYGFIVLGTAVATQLRDALDF
ncbi:MAG: hypothetical protein IID41_12340 [Planctomycetes bacterium]|nr:hypothetical protein [Planctomycetota bacterium]